MELFVFVSFLGTFVLLTTHVVDYAVGALRPSVRTVRISMPNEEAPNDVVPLPIEIVNLYDRAA
jgi:hypothetical protein